jgi:protein SCO1/2
MLPADALTAAQLDAVAAGVYVGQLVDPPVRVQDFLLPGSENGSMSLSDSDGMWRVMFIGYMHCPDLCPLTLVDYKQAIGMLGEDAAEVRFVFISVDAQRDTPEKLRPYLDHFDPSIIGFSADDATLSQIQPDYGFFYERRLESDPLAVYSIDHSTRSYLIDPQGLLRASFSYATDPEIITKTLRWYLDQ